MSDGIAFLLWLVFVGISAIIIGYFLKYHAFNVSIKKESFLVVGCPSGTTNYITDSGESNCCNGDVIDGECNGNNVCTLSPNNREGLPTCAELHTRAAEATGIAKCPREIPNYFASSNGSLKGCSVSNIMPDGSGPIDTAALQCILYPTAALDSSRLDSCQNYVANKMALDAAKASCAAPGSSPGGASASADSATASSARSSVLKFLGSDPSITPLTSRLTSSPPPVANPTGYVMSGTDIVGEIPVIKVINAPDSTTYLAQNGNSINVNMIHAGSMIHEDFSAVGILPNTITDFPSLFKFFQSDNVGLRKLAKYTTKKLDGSLVDTPDVPHPPSSTNPSDYILTGGTPPLPNNIQVVKIFNDSSMAFFAQDGDIIRSVVLTGGAGKEDRYYFGLSKKGNVSILKSGQEFFDMDSIVPGKDYILKKKDGSETYAP
jgi:hypothetical protein